MKNALLILLVACSSGSGQRQAKGWADGIALGQAEDQDPDTHIVDVSLEARVAPRELRPGVVTELWTYDGQVPGPTLRVRRGDVLRVRFTNHLPAPTTIHWHGLRIDAAMDGSEMTQAPIQPGASFTYEFTPPDAGTYWYHPHHDSSGQVGQGLYGALIVEDDEPPLGDEAVLVLSDASVKDDGSLRPPNDTGWFGDYFGREGNVLLVNGRVLPEIKTRTGAPERWRIINASRARFYELSVPDHVLEQVASDGGLLERPRAIGSLRLVPGERMDVVVTPKPEAASRTEVMWHDMDRYGIGYTRDPERLFVLVKSDLPPWSEPARSDAVMRDFSPLDVSTASTRRIELGEKAAGGTTVLAINGQAYSEALPIDAHVGTTEIWEIVNTTSYDHPFHLHGFSFQVLDNKNNLRAREWKDTVNVRGKSTVRFAVYFDDRPGMWMFHCHSLAHAALGMMGMLHVIGHEDTHR